MPQPKRTETLERFKNGEIRLLVASDVAARGLDIKGMSHVFSFDVPIHAEDYVHRIGRTGRAGREGRSFMLAAPEDGKAVAAITKLIGKEIPPIAIDGIEPARARIRGTPARTLDPRAGAKAPDRTKTPHSRRKTPQDNASRQPRPSRPEHRAGKPRADRRQRQRCERQAAKDNAAKDNAAKDSERHALSPRGKVPGGRRDLSMSGPTGKTIASLSGLAMICRRFSPAAEDRRPPLIASEPTAMKTIFVMVKCDLGKAYTVADEAVQSIEQVSEVYSTSGQYDLLMKCYLPDTVDIGTFRHRAGCRSSRGKDTFTIIGFKAFSEDTSR